MNFLKQEITIKQVQIKNRLVLPPMATSKASQGFVSDNILSYYDEKSKGGYIGLIITEHSYVNKQGMASIGQMSISQDADIEGLRKLVNIIHNNGSKVIAQISHAGSSAREEVTGFSPISASAVLNNGATGKSGKLPKAMTQQDINEVIASFALSAKRAKDAGFDGVQIHSAHGYLLNQFYSPLTNHRTDEYCGKTLEGRLKIHKQIIKAIRDVVGQDYLLSLRLGGCDYQDNGSTIADSVAAAKLLEKWGIDLLDISGGLNGYVVHNRPSAGWFSDMSKAIKESVSIPVILTGGFSSAEDANTFLEQGCADFIGVGRAMLKNANWTAENMS